MPWKILILLISILTLIEKRKYLAISIHLRVLDQENLISSVNFHLWLQFGFKFDVLFKKIKELIRTVEETILKIVLSNDHFIVCQDTQRSWLFKISMTILSSNCKVTRARGYAPKCLSTNFQINNLKMYWMKNRIRKRISE